MKKDAADLKKIAFLINSLGKGGAERVTVRLIEHFKAAGYEVVLVTSRKAPEEYQLKTAVKRRLLEEEIRSCPIKPVARIFGLRRIWREEKPDVIVSFIGKMNLYAMLSAGRIPVILSVRSDPAREYPSRIQKLLAERLFRRAAGVVFQTKEAMEAFSKEVQARGCVLQNALDESFMEPAYEGERRDEIVMVGRLDANKNHALLLRAFAELKERYPKLQVIFYGGGLPGSDTKPALLELARELGISERVTFAGRQKDIRKKIEKARIFVLASNYEGMPNALLEAMAAGLAVISTDCPCGGPRAVIRDGENGLLIPVGDKEALKKALCRILDDADFAAGIGHEAEKIKEMLSPLAVCRAWQDEIESRVKEYAGRQS